MKIFMTKCVMCAPGYDIVIESELFSEKELQLD